MSELFERHSPYPLPRSLQEASPATGGLPTKQAQADSAHGDGAHRAMQEPAGLLYNEAGVLVEAGLPGWPRKELKNKLVLNSERNWANQGKKKA